MTTPWSVRHHYQGDRLRAWVLTSVASCGGWRTCGWLSPRKPVFDAQMAQMLELLHQDEDFLHIDLFEHNVSSLFRKLMSLTSVECTALELSPKRTPRRSQDNVTFAEVHAPPTSYGDPGAGNQVKCPLIVVTEPSPIRQVLQTFHYIKRITRIWITLTFETKIWTLIHDRYSLSIGLCWSEMVTYTQAFIMHISLAQNANGTNIAGVPFTNMA